MTADPNKGITSIAYNHMNLPITITFTGSRSIAFLYDAGGNKLRKTVVQSGVTQYIQDYVGGIEYRTASGTTTLEAIYHAEGRVTTINGSLKYEYALKDHLGNTRLMFCDKNSDGYVQQSTVQESSEITQENHYYSFGLQMEGTWMNTPSVTDSKYLFNGKEMNDDFGLGLMDYGARMYDAAIGRWNRFDPFAEKTSYNTPYNYGDNNPINMKDNDGNFAVSVHYNTTFMALRDLGYSEKDADLMAHYASVYADHPNSTAIRLDRITNPYSASATTSYYREGIDYSRTAGSQKEENSMWHSMMSDAEADGGMTHKEALDRGLEFGWEQIFKYAAGGGKDLGQFGQGIHALQDAVAHGGSSTDEHLGLNLRMPGMLKNDAYGNPADAYKLTKSAIIVSEVLQGKQISLKTGDRINMTGMSNDQKKQVRSALEKQGYSVQNVYEKKEK